LGVADDAAMPALNGAEAVVGNNTYQRSPTALDMDGLSDREALDWTSPG
jgi:hypothetical protein